MCCGGTVPMIEHAPPAAKPRYAPSARASATSEPQVCAWGCGRPVLPEVYAISASRSAPKRGTSKAPPDCAKSGVMIAGRPGGSPSPSDRQYVSGWLASRSRTAPGAREYGSKLTCPATIAAANPSMKLSLSSHKLSTWRLRGSSAASAIAVLQKRPASIALPPCQPIASSARKRSIRASSGAISQSAVRRFAPRPVARQTAQEFDQPGVPMVTEADPAIEVLADEEQGEQRVADEIREHRPQLARPGERQGEGNGRHDDEEQHPEAGQDARVAGEVGRQLAAALDAGEAADHGLVAVTQRGGERPGEREVDGERWREQDRRRPQCA